MASNRPTFAVHRTRNANNFFVCISVLSCVVFLQIHLSSATYFADWSSIGGIGREDQPVCVSIPSNMSLCQNIGYTQMRLPNLLEHDTIQEVSQQAASWIPLLNVKCHDDTQLFLCSLFAPVSIDMKYLCSYSIFSCTIHSFVSTAKNKNGTKRFIFHSKIKNSLSTVFAQQN